MRHNSIKISIRLLKGAKILMLYLFSLNPFLAKGQGIKFDFRVSQPSCIKSIGHNLEQSGDGSIRVDNISNGVPPYSFRLLATALGGIYGQSTLITQNNGYFPGLYDGHYSLTVTDAVGVTATIDTQLVSRYPWPVLGTGFSRPSDCTSPDGSIGLYVTNGTPPYLYSVDGGNNYSTNNIVKNLAPGMYIPLAMDSNGCVSSYYKTVNEPLYLSSDYYGNTCILFVSSPNASITSCRSEGSISVHGYYRQTNADTVPTGNNSNLQFSLDGVHYHVHNVFSTGGIPSDTAKGLAPGNYTYYVKDTVTGLVSSWNFFIPRSCDVYIGYVFVMASCGASDGSLTVQARDGAAPYTYSMDGVHFKADSIFTGLSSGSYGISVKDASGNITSSQATVYNKCPALNAVATNEHCGQKDGTIQAHGYLGTKNYQFSLDNLNYQSDSLFTKLTKNSYTVYIRDAKGFVDSIANVMVSGVCLNVTTVVTNENCGHSDGTITATGADGTPPYNYSIDGINFKSSNIFTNLPHSNYTITIKDANLLTATAQQTIINLLPPTINFGNDTTLCPGQKLNLSLTISNASYKWQDGSVNSSFTVSQAGKYWVTANINGCSSSDTINVSYRNLGKLFTTNDTTGCIGNTITLDAGHAGANFLWNDNSNKQTRSVNSDGKYWVNVTIGGCSVSDTITCHFVPPPIIVFPSDTSFCSTQQLILNAGNINATYLWNDGTIGSTLVVKKAGIYIVAATASGCTTYDTIRVSIKPNPQIALGSDTTVCAGQTVTINATDKNANSNATYFWQDGSKLPLYTVSKQGSYSVKVSTNSCDTTGTIKITYADKPKVNLGADTTLCNTDQLVLDATYPQSSYLWQDGSSKPSFTVAQAGIYSVDVTNYCGTVTDSIGVQYENCNCVFYIPSAFSPNGDGKNDVFKPSYKCLFANYKLNIYSRYGKIIFTSSNADNGWDGLVNGLQQPAGVYVWEMSYFDTFTNKAIVKRGTMVLVR